MNSAEEKKIKKFHIIGTLTAILWTLVCIMLLVWGFGDYNDKERMETRKATMEARQRVEKLDREMRALQRKHDNGQDLKIRSHDERLKVLETAVVDLLTANPKVVQPAVRQDDSAKSASDEDFRAMVLKNVKDKDRMAIVRHFRQEDEFKKSLKPSERRKFDADVKKAYEELLAECKIAKGSLDKWQANALRQSVETGVILEWRMDDYSNRQVAVKPVSKEQRQNKLEKLRLLEGQLEEFGVETEAE